MFDVLLNVSLCYICMFIHILPKYALYRERIYHLSNIYPFLTCCCIHYQVYSILHRTWPRHRSTKDLVHILNMRFKKEVQTTRSPLIISFGIFSMAVFVLFNVVSKSSNFLMCMSISLIYVN